MEVQIGVGKRLSGMPRASHLPHATAESHDVGTGTTACCKRRRRRFHGAPDFPQAREESVIEPDLHPPREHVSIKKAPINGIAHPCPNSGLGEDETLCGECLHHLPQNGARHVKASHQLRLRRQVVARPEDASQSLTAQNRGNLVLTGEPPAGGETTHACLPSISLGNCAPTSSC